MLYFLATDPLRSIHNHKHSTHSRTLETIAKMSNVVSLDYRSNERGNIAIITIDNQKKLNAMTQDDYYHLSKLLKEVAEREDVYITILTAKGRFFSAYAFLDAPLLSRTLLKLIQGSRCNNTSSSCRVRRCISPAAQELRLEQSQCHPSFLHAPKDPSHRFERSSRWSVGRADWLC